MSWKFFLFSFIIFSTSALGNCKTTRKAYIPDDQPVIAAQNDNLLESIDLTSVKKKKRVVAKRYVKRCDQVKTITPLDQPQSNPQNQSTDPPKLKSLQVDQVPSNDLFFSKVPPTYKDKVHKRIRVKKYIKKYTKASDTQQLVILYPENNSELVANTTSNLYVDTTTLTKSTNTDVDSVVSFTCPSGTFNVTVPLGANTTYVVDPLVNGNCTIIAYVLNNTNYIPSLPIYAGVYVPIYFSGLDEASYFTGEKVNLFARPSNDAVLPFDVIIGCGHFSKTINMLTNNQPFVFEFPPLLIGNCEVRSDTNIPYYLTFTPFEIQIDPSIFFIRPHPNSTYKAGEDILVNLFATDNNSTLAVTVNLYCNGLFIKSLTQNIQTTFTFTPDQNVNGNCELSMDDVDGYFTEQTVPIIVLKELYFVYPKENELIVPGTFYDIQVNGNAPDGSVNILITGRCSSGGIFNETVQINVKKTVLMGLSFSGFCTLTATATGFFDAIVPILVFTPLTPEEMAAEALRLQLVGTIFKKTENTD